MSHNIPQRACGFCGKLFFPRAANQTYHDDLCRDRAYRQRSKGRRAPKELSISEYFNTYFAQVFQDVGPTLAQAIFKGAQADPNRRYAVTSWSDPDNTIVPANIAVSKELKDEIEYYNVHASVGFQEESVTSRLTVPDEAEWAARLRAAMASGNFGTLTDTKK